MPKLKKNSTAANHTDATIGYEARLWQRANALPGRMDAAECTSSSVLSSKYISDAFEEQHAKLEAERAQCADPEDPDEYRAFNIFWMPPEARWAYLKAGAKHPTAGSCTMP